MKSGWAAVVLLTGANESPSVIDSCRIDLSDPRDPESIQPYHAMEGRTEAAGEKETDRLVKVVMRKGVQSVARLIESYRSKGHRIKAARLVVGSLTDPSKISNPHIRWHALEGQLFRKVVEEGLKSFRLPFESMIERNMYEHAAKVLKWPEKQIRQTLMEIGRKVDGPWRAEQKAACLAAWTANSR